MFLSRLPLVVQVIITGLLLYVAFAALVFVLQRRLLYYPSPTRPPEAAVQSAGMASWPAGEQGYRGYIGRDSIEAVKGTVVVFHGNAGAAADRSYYVRALTPLGYRVLLAEYPGYGGRPGRPSEAALIADARQTLALAYEEFGAPLYVWGESLGAGVASALASDGATPVDGVILVTPWANLPDLAQSIYWFFPARRLVLDRYDNIANLQSYAGPVAVVLAERDEVVPIEHGQRLFDALPGPKRLWIQPNAGHNSWPIAPHAPWWREVMTFVAG